MSDFLARHSCGRLSACSFVALPIHLLFLQALQAINDVNSLCIAMSSNRIDGPIHLRDAVIPKPTSSTTNSTTWRSVKMWPHQAEIDWTNVYKYAQPLRRFLAAKLQLHFAARPAKEHLTC